MKSASKFFAMAIFGGLLVVELCATEASLKNDIGRTAQDYILAVIEEDSLRLLKSWPTEIIKKEGGAPSIIAQLKSNNNALVADSLQFTGSKVEGIEEQATRSGNIFARILLSRDFTKHGRPVTLKTKVIVWRKNNNWYALDAALVQKYHKSIVPPWAYKVLNGQRRITTKRGKTLNLEFQDGAEIKIAGN